MNDWSIWKLTKAGFWLGIGFIIPSLIVYAVGTLMVVKMSPHMYDDTMGEIEDSYEGSDVISNISEQFNKSSQIKILEHNEEKYGEQLLILGKIKNTGKTDVSSIQLEAELFNSQEKFIFECSKYISKTLKPGDIENFQIKCGCKGQATPQHSSLKVRVVSASTY